MNLRKARESSLEDFIKERESDPDGDLDKLDALIKRPTQGSGKEVPTSSPPASSDD